MRKAKSCPHKKYVLLQYNHHLIYIHHGSCGIHGEENSEQKDFDASSINAVKSSLMGPLAGIGDSIFWGVLRVIAAGIAVGLGASGNVLAPIVFLLLFNIPSILVKYYGTFLGYKLGSEYIQKVYASGLMNILTKAASIVGLIMVGGMTAAW